MDELAPEVPAATIAPQVVIASDTPTLASPAKQPAHRGAPKWETETRDKVKATVKKFSKPLADVTYESAATNLAPGQIDTNSGSDSGRDIFIYGFIYGRATEAVTLVSHSASSATTTANGSSTFFPSISAGGAFVAFLSFATDLVVGQNDTNAASDVFVYQRATGEVALVSHAPVSAVTTANARTNGGPLISADGAFVAISSAATHLVAGQIDANGNTLDTFVYERATGAPSVSTNGETHPPAPSPPPTAAVLEDP